MIFLQCVGSVCRSRKRASYLQGGSEIIIRIIIEKQNLLDTEPFSHVFSRKLPTASNLNQSQRNLRGGGGGVTVKRLWAAAEHLVAHRPCLQKLSSWSSATTTPHPPSPSHKSPSKPLWTCQGKPTEMVEDLSAIEMKSLSVGLWSKIWAFYNIYHQFSFCHICSDSCGWNVWTF